MDGIRSVFGVGGKVTLKLVAQLRSSRCGEALKLVEDVLVALEAY